MFRKPKRSAKAGLRKRSSDDDKGKDANSMSDGKMGTKDNSSDDDDIAETREELQQARKRSKKGGGNYSDDSSRPNEDGNVMHHFKADNKLGNKVTVADLATSTVQHHPTAISGPGAANDSAAAAAAPAPTKPSQKRNKFLAGPIKAPTNIRTTCRFDYQPDICKDYKDTGFCGFGDTCIYLHDRGDTLSGWQLEQQWEQEQAKKKQEQEKQMDAFIASASSGGAGDANGGDNDAINTDDGIPFACYICRNAFTDPVVTNCSHYFCERCIMDHVINVDSSGKCPVCNKETNRVFHQPTKLISKKRRVVSSKATWEEYYNAMSSN